MAEELQIISTVQEAHDAAVREVHRWRGHCVDLYARLERGLTLTIDSLGIAVGTNASVFGERLKRVTSAVTPEGSHPHAKTSAALRETLDHTKRRNMLVHAVGGVFIDARGDWFWRYNYQPSKAKAPPENGSFSRSEGERMEAELEEKVRSICAHLQSLRDTHRNKKKAVTE